MGLYTEKDPFHEEISTQMEKNTPELLQLNGIIKIPRTQTNNNLFLTSNKRRTN